MVYRLIIWLVVDSLVWDEWGVDRLASKMRSFWEMRETISKFARFAGGKMMDRATGMVAKCALVRMTVIRYFKLEKISIDLVQCTTQAIASFSAQAQDRS